MSGGAGGAAGGGGSGGGESGGGGGGDGGLRSRELSRGPKWLQRAFNLLRIDVIANRPVPGNGTTITQSPTGRAVNAVGKAGGGGGAAGDTLPMYFIDGGVLKTGDFSVSNIADIADL